MSEHIRLARYDGMPVVTVDHKEKLRFMYRDGSLDKTSKVGNTPSVDFSEIAHDVVAREAAFEFEEQSERVKYSPEFKAGRLAVKNVAGTKISAPEILAA